MRIYVAAPYSAETAEGRFKNTQRAIDAGIALMNKGHTPFIPHLTHYVEARMFETEGKGRPWEFWMAQDDAFLQQCEALVYLASSRGADRELVRAGKLGLKIYFSVDDIPLAQSLQGNPKADARGPSSQLPVEILRLPHGEGIDLPQYGTDGAAGLDLCAAVPEGQMFEVYPGEIAKIPTGICVAIPPGYAGLVLSRSGIATRCNVALANQPGLVDSDFRGEIFLALRNRGDEPFVYQRGNRLAQFLLIPVPGVQWQEVTALDQTERAEGGWGSTGR